MTLGSRAWLVAGLVALVGATVISVASRHWSTEGGAHGPIILTTGLWLLWRARDKIAAHEAPVRSPWWTLALVPLLLAQAFSTAYGILSVQTGSLWLILVLLAYGYWGPAVLQRVWFPLLYLAFLIVPPGSMVAEATLPLKLWISNAAVDLLYMFGYPVAQTGAAIHIDQYELLVETACAGLGSMLTLSALGLLYIHLRHESGFRRSMILLALLIPIAILANLVRVIALVLMTYHIGNDFAQGFAHDLAGMLMFIVAMLLMFAVDFAMQRASDRMPRRA